MTWAEFKAAVEAAGVEDDHELGYIDVASAWTATIEVRVTPCADSTVFSVTN